MADWETGDADFDAAFIVSGSGIGSVREYLTPEVRQAIMRLRAVSHRNLSIRTTGEQMLLRRPRWLVTEEEIDTFLAEIDFSLSESNAKTEIQIA